VTDQQLCSFAPQETAQQPPACDTK
jgi:hypothetical protein